MCQNEKAKWGFPSWLSDLLNVMKNFSFRHNDTTKHEQISNFAVKNLYIPIISLIINGIVLNYFSRHRIFTK